MLYVERWARMSRGCGGYCESKLAIWADNRYMLLYPLLTIFTPSPKRAMQSILFALMAPVRYGSISETHPSSKSTGISTDKAESLDPRRSGVSGGDTIRDCEVIE